MTAPVSILFLPYMNLLLPTYTVHNYVARGVNCAGTECVLSNDAVRWYDAADRVCTFATSTIVLLLSRG